MKRTIYFSLILALILISCEKTPVAQFHTSTVKPDVGQTVLFTNDSQNAAQFEWDFGDGYGSTEANPSHVYTGTGVALVTLKAISKSGLSDQATIDMEIMIPTLLEIQVLEYYQEYVVPNADIWLYTSITDWDKHNNNFISTGKTDANGYAVFSGLDPFVYYVDVYEKNHDNYLLRNEVNGINFIRTAEIIPNQINRFTAWVDYYSKKGSGVSRGTDSFIIKKIERNITDKGNTTITGGTEGWQDLYKRSVTLKK
jgi:PKD repeat protein